MRSRLRLWRHRWLMWAADLLVGACCLLAALAQLAAGATLLMLLLLVAGSTLIFSAPLIRPQLPNNHTNG